MSVNLRVESFRDFAARWPRPTVLDTPNDPAFPEAVDLISRQRIVDLSVQAARDADFSWATWVAALLTVSLRNGFLRFDPWDPAILIKSFQDSPVQYQFNPHRVPQSRHAPGQERAPAAGPPPDFLDWETFPDNEHFLIWHAESGRRYGILVQPAPIVPGHLIVATLDPDPERGRHYEQRMRPEHLRDMDELLALLGPLGYLFGYNERGAGASVDHFHTQAMPAVYLPLARAMGQGRPLAWEPLPSDAGVRVRVLSGGRESAGGRLWRNWAARFAGRERFPIAGVMLSSRVREALAAAELTWLEKIRRKTPHFNLLAWMSQDGTGYRFFVPRAKENLDICAIKAGFVEMGGMVVLPDAERFHDMSKPGPGLLALSETTISSKEIEEK